MSDTPKFTVVDRRKFRAEEEAEPSVETAASTPVQESAGKPTVPRLTLVEPIQTVATDDFSVAVADKPEEQVEESYEDPQLPPAPTSEEFAFQKATYEKAAERLDDLVRAQNPGAPPQEKIGFEHLVQQLYLSAMMQMGAGTPEGQRPRIDILGARQTIDLLDVVLAKSEGNLAPQEERTLLTVLFELRMTFLELTRMIATQAQQPLPPPPGAPAGPKR